MKLAIFDVDETLVRTGGLDADCYEQALRETFDLSLSDVAWDDRPHMSDWGITSHLFERCLRRSAEQHELERIMRRFLALLRDACRSQATALRPIPGAQTVFDALRAHGWACAIATGGWHCSAEFKLDWCQIPYTDHPGAHSEDGPSRRRIVETAMRRATDREGRFDRVVCVGDGVWDVETAAALGLGFVGVGAAERADALVAAGAANIVRDYADVRSVVTALELATVPHPAGSDGARRANR